MADRINARFPGGGPFWGHPEGQIVGQHAGRHREAGVDGDARVGAPEAVERARSEASGDLTIEGPTLAGSSTRIEPSAAVPTPNVLESLPSTKSVVSTSPLLIVFVTLEPSIDAGAVVLTPTSVEATTDAASVDLSTLVDLDALTVRACAASLLPESMELTGVDVAGSRLHFSVSGQDVPIDVAQLTLRPA